MRYYYGYAICALVFLIIIMVSFFSARRFPNTQNRVFAVILWLAAADLTLDIISALTIEYAAYTPAWISYIITTLFYSLQAAFPTVMVLYLFVIRDGSLKKKKSLRLLMIPAAALVLIVLTSYFTHWIFYITVEDGVIAYVQGPLFNMLYVSSAFYVAVTLFLTLRYRHILKKKQFVSIVAFVTVVIAAAIIQFLYPKYLLTGMAITSAMMMTSFTLQNPEDMLDLISGVFNYSAMMEFLDIQISEGRQLWLISADIGGLRRVNSAFGVTAGNTVFTEIGKFFNSLEGGVWTFRMVGTRFLLLASTAENFRLTIDAIEERFKESWHVQDKSVSLSVTIRYFSEWNFFQSPEDVINLIDIAYSEIGAEAWGMKKRISTDLMLQVKRRLLVENAIRESLKSGSGFSLNFQPIYNPAGKCFSCVEALLRLDNPTLGSIPPSEFIPVAEKTGMILQIDELVINKVCEFYIRNEKDLRGVVTRLNINFSAAEFFKNPSIRIHWLIHDHHIPPDLICFEVTETAATSHPGSLASFMNEMIALGYHFALDDFGTGYANTSRMVHLPFETVKLDKSLLVLEDEKSRILFSYMLSMFSRIGTTTIVEGVETREQAELACSQGADMIQGFYYARPMPEQDLIAFLRAGATEDMYLSC